MNEKISNPKVEVPSTKEMNDCDYLTDILETEKNMSVNLCIALNEASNEELYNELFECFKKVKNLQRKLYEKMFELGWYSLEKADDQKISQKEQELSNKRSELT